jgi:SAM-dependent methyltransferase
MGRASRAGRRPAGRRGGIRLSDILAGQPADERLLAELYDLEHDEIVEDLGFYRTWAHRHPAAVLDLGCGTGRLFRTFLDGGARRLVGIDGSPALLERAAARIQADEVLRDAFGDGRIELATGDVRTVSRPERFSLIVLAGVIAHLDGPEDALRVLSAAGRLLRPDGVLIVDQLGPGALPVDDLPLSLDWERRLGDRRVVRRSRLDRREAPEGLRVEYSTLTDVAEADGTITRLPAGFRLWYPSPEVTVALAGEASLEVVAAFGSHDLEPLDDRSERCIVVLGNGIRGPGQGE